MALINTVFALLVAVSAFLINISITPLVLFLSHKFHWYDDDKDHRKIHKGNIPRLGGIGIFLGWIISFFTVQFFYTSLYGGDSGINFAVFHFLPIFSAALLIFILGFIDDFYALVPVLKLIGQFVAAILITYWGGFYISELVFPFSWIHFSLGIWGKPLTIFWLVAISNAVNLIDGMDGLAGTISACAAFVIGVSSILEGNLFAGLGSLALMGGILAFMIFNYPPAHIFMGDCGSLFVGFILAVLPLTGGKTSNVVMVIPLTMFGIPILDTISAILRRLRKKKPIFSADKDHFHHKLLRFGLSTRQTLLVVLILSFILAIASFAWLYTGHNIGAVIILISWAIATAFFLILDGLRRREDKKNATLES